MNFFESNINAIHFIEKELTIGIDFDGVINSYKSGFVSSTEIPDEPVKDAIDSIKNLLDKNYKVFIFSARANTEEGKKAIKDYLEKYNLKSDKIIITNIKSPEIGLFIDDKAITFKGDWNSTLDKIDSFKSWVYENKKLFESSFYSIDEFKNKMINLNLSAGKAPKNKKDIFESLKRIERILKQIKEFGEEKSTIFYPQIEVELKRYSKQEWDDLFNLLQGKTKEKTELELNKAIYINNSIISEKSFIELSNMIEKFLNTLTGIHEKALKAGKKITIKFVKASDIKSKAKYVERENAIYIRPDRVSFNIKGYASFPYILVHELGHRYLNYYKQNNFFTQEYYLTTKYSKTPSLSEEEPFAELFALSFWKKDYPEYELQINRFLKEVK